MISQMQDLYIIFVHILNLVDIHFDLHLYSYNNLKKENYAIVLVVEGSEKREREKCKTISAR